MTTPLFTRAQIDLLANDKTISYEHPWFTGDEKQIDAWYRFVCDEIASRTLTVSHVEDYSSGYASYIDAWLFRPTLAFVEQQLEGEEASWVGLQVLLCRLAPVYVFLEATRCWGPNSFGGLYHDLQSVDNLTTPAVIALAARVEPVLERYRLRRLRREELETVLPDDVGIYAGKPPPFTEYDALFHWED